MNSNVDRDLVHILAHFSADANLYLSAYFEGEGKIYM